MGTRFRSWWQQIKQHPYKTFIVVSSVVFWAFILFILLAYRFGWDWTGFTGGESKVTTTMITPGTTTTTTPRATVATEQQPAKTLWDWLGLFAVLTLPAVVALGAAWFTVQQGKESDRENKDNQRETALQAYIDKMSELLLHEMLRDSAEEDEVRKIARVRTLTILPRLDANRKGSVLQFLYESGLIDKDKCIIDLNGADLSDADLSKADLSRASLQRANLNGASLTIARLQDASLQYANLKKADLVGAIMNKVNLSLAYLYGANLNYADLRDADLNGANLNDANLNDANLNDANLSGASLIGVTGITVEELERQAKSLKGATMPDGSRHP